MPRPYPQLRCVPRRSRVVVVVMAAGLTVPFAGCGGTTVNNTTITRAPAKTVTVSTTRTVTKPGQDGSGPIGESAAGKSWSACPTQNRKAFLRVRGAITCQQARVITNNQGNTAGFPGFSKRVVGLSEGLCSVFLVSNGEPPAGNLEPFPSGVAEIKEEAVMGAPCS